MIKETREFDWIIEDNNGLVFVSFIIPRDKRKRPAFQWSKNPARAMGFNHEKDAQKYIVTRSIHHLGLHVCQRKNAGCQIHD